MTSLPTVSAIIPTRNRVAFLCQAVESVVAQRLRPTELFIVDDGGDPQALRDARDAAASAGIPATLIEGPRRGPGAARNAGLKEASGELIAFLDDDDLWLPEKLERQVGWFARRPRLGVLGTGRIEGLQLPAMPCRSASTARISPVPLGLLLRANRLAASSVIARRKSLEDCGAFDEALPLAQDWDLWLRVAARWEVAVLPAPLIFYRRHPEQRSTDFMEMRYWEGEVVRRALARGLPSIRLAGIARRRLAWSHVRMGRLKAAGGDVERARVEFVAAMGLCCWSPGAWEGLARCWASRLIGGALGRDSRVAGLPGAGPRPGGKP